MDETDKTILISVLGTFILTVVLFTLVFSGIEESVATKVAQCVLVTQNAEVCTAPYK